MSLLGSFISRADFINEDGLDVYGRPGPRLSATGPKPPLVFGEKGEPNHPYLLIHWKMGGPPSTQFKMLYYPVSTFVNIDLLKGGKLVAGNVTAPAYHYVIQKASGVKVPYSVAEQTVELSTTYGDGWNLLDLQGTLVFDSEKKAKVPLTAAMLNVAFEPWGYHRTVKGRKTWTGVAAQMTWQVIGASGSFYSAALYGSMA